MTAPLHGIVAYPITPFTTSGAVDERLLSKIVRDMLDAGVHAIAPLGSTGVLPYLSDDEREMVTSVTIDTVRGRVPTLVGVSSLTTERTVHHARFAEGAGASAVMIIPMSYWKLSEREIVAHFDAIARAISIPIAVYNNPATGGLDLSPETIRRLLEIPNVTMVKESTGDVNRMHKLVQLCGSDVAFYNGSNPLALAALIAGARGWCTAAPHVIPHLNVALYDAVVAGDIHRARSVLPPAPIFAVHRDARPSARDLCGSRADGNAGRTAPCAAASARCIAGQRAAAHSRRARRPPRLILWSLRGRLEVLFARARQDRALTRVYLSMSLSGRAVAAVQARIEAEERRLLAGVVAATIPASRVPHPVAAAFWLQAATMAVAAQGARSTRRRRPRSRRSNPSSRRRSAGISSGRSRRSPRESRLGAPASVDAHPLARFCLENGIASRRVSFARRASVALALQRMWSSVSREARAARRPPVERLDVGRTSRRDPVRAVPREVSGMQGDAGRVRRVG